MFRSWCKVKIASHILIKPIINSVIQTKKCFLNTSQVEKHSFWKLTVQILLGLASFYLALEVGRRKHTDFPGTRLSSLAPSIRHVKSRAFRMAPTSPTSERLRYFQLLPEPIADGQLKAAGSPGLAEDVLQSSQPLSPLTSWRPRSKKGRRRGNLRRRGTWMKRAEGLSVHNFHHHCDLPLAFLWDKTAVVLGSQTSLNQPGPQALGLVFLKIFRSIKYESLEL